MIIILNQADELSKLKKIRGVTKNCHYFYNKKNKDIHKSDTPNLVEFKETLAQLEQIGNDLKGEDNDILLFLDDLSEVEKDAKASSKYHDNITLWKFGVNKKKLKLN